MGHGLVEGAAGDAKQVPSINAHDFMQKRAAERVQAARSFNGILDTKEAKSRAEYAKAAAVSPCESRLRSARRDNRGRSRLRVSVTGPPIDTYFAPGSVFMDVTLSAAEIYFIADHQIVVMFVFLILALCKGCFPGRDTLRLVLSGTCACIYGHRGGRHYQMCCTGDSERRDR